MRGNRRRNRKADDLASRSSVRDLLDRFISENAGTTPDKHPDLIKFLRAFRHIQRYSATDNKRGRPSRWPREILLSVGARFESFIGRETAHRMSSATFIDHYLRILEFPPDIETSLSAGKINIFEAEQLFRVKTSANGLSRSDAIRIRSELISTHVKARLSGDRLRARINEILGRNDSRTSKNSGSAEIPLESTELDNLDAYDASHLFWDEIRQLEIAFSSLRRDDVSDSEIEELLKACEPVWTVLNRIQRRKDQSKTRGILPV